MSEPKKILAITACPTGIAHTYMAAEKLQEAAEAMGHQIHVETHGSIGVENAISDEEIREADAVVIAADKQIDTTRFKGIPIAVAGVAEGIKRPEALIEKALNAKPATGERAAGADVTGAPAKKERESVGGTLYRALMNGVSHMIPFVVTGGLLIAIALAIGGEPTEAGLAIPEGSFWKTIEQIGALAFGLMVPILSGFIAMAIADRPGLAPGMITGVIAVTGSLYGSEAGAGFLGGIITGFASGYVALLIKKIPVHKYIAPIMPIIIIPILTTLIVGLAFVYLLGGPIALAFEGLTNWLAGMTGASAIVLGLILGAMIAFDMGGPVNKTAFLFGGGLIAAGNAAPMGMVAAAIAIPPIGMGLATLIRRKLFNRQQRDSGIAALFMGFFGITEGAIPFAAARPLQVIPANMIGGAVGGAIAALFMVKDNVMHGGPIVAVLGAVENVPMYFVAIIVGSLVTALVAIALLSIGNKGSDTAGAGEPALATAGAPAAVAQRSSGPSTSGSTAASAAAAPAAATTAAAAPAVESSPATDAPKSAEPKISEYLSAETIDLNVEGSEPEQVIRRLAGLGADTGAIADVDRVVDAALAREGQGPTAVGDGIAIPHAKSDGASRPVLAFGRSSGVDWGAPDDKPADLIFLIAVPEAQAGDEHLRILAGLSRALMRGPVRDGLRNASSADEVIQVLEEALG